MNTVFYIHSVLFGISLAVDAFSVSVANGLNEPNMRPSKENTIAGCFALFQFLMPVIGWVCVHTLLQLFSALQKWIPWIALILLVFIGGKMLREGIRGASDPKNTGRKLEVGQLVVQAVATSIDALSVGFTIADLGPGAALLESLIIGIITFVLCKFGVKLGRRAGTALAGKAGIIGGVILILIGLEIWLKAIL